MENLCSGDLVIDWTGRPGIAIDRADRVDAKELHQFWDSRLLQLPPRTVWWTIALLGGGTVKSPEPLTDTLGQADPLILRMAIRDAPQVVKRKLEYMLKRTGHTNAGEQPSGSPETNVRTVR